MAIPGRELDKVDVRAKVRNGIKKNGKPASVDHFVSEDEEFKRLFPGEPKTIRILPAYADAERTFSTGLEWWRGKLLACYTKDGGSNPVALRVAEMKSSNATLNFLDPDDEKRGPLVGNGRQPITCKGDACRHFGQNAGNKECRPMGRLTFFLEGGRTDQALQLDTKGWNSIENLAGTLAAAARSGSLIGRVFELSVHFERKGTSRFPVLTIKEADTEINTPEDVEKAEAFLALHKALASKDEPTIRLSLAEALNRTNPGWRDNPAFIERIKEIGVIDAAKGLLERHAA